MSVALLDIFCWPLTHNIWSQWPAMIISDSAYVCVTLLFLCHSLRYIVRGSRGDFNLPGAIWQVLHSDVWKEWLIDTAPTEYPDSGRLNYRDLPVFHVVINFNVIDIHALNAPIRQIPMTQHSQRVL